VNTSTSPRSTASASRAGFENVLAYPCRHHDAPEGTPCWTRQRDGLEGLCATRCRTAGQTVVKATKPAKKAPAPEPTKPKKGRPVPSLEARLKDFRRSQLAHS
jgi:hypothetical protein